jgi:prolipoprotein diacylglyceryltransferase
MSAALSPHPEAPTAEGWRAVRALARVEAKRFAGHPLFLFGIALILIPMVAAVWRHEVDANPMTGTLFIAFLIGTFGFIVAHRLTTSMLRTRDLATTKPVSRQQRTLALCLACLVPATAGVVVAVFMLITAAIWEPVGDPVTAHVAWFRDDPAVDVLATLIAMGPVAALGGPLLGVAVARWAPFRGSALIGVVTLVFLSALPSDEPVPWRVLSPWPILVDEYVEEGGGAIVRSSFVPGVEPIWIMFFLLCLCGLAVVAALLRDSGHRRALLGTGGALTVCAVGSFLLAVA